jgi:hypothetical protein
MGDPLYAREKLGEAVDELVTGIGPLRDRLFEAALFLIRIDPDNEL